MRRRERSSDKIEQTLVKAILSGHYPVGSTLPPERELAKTFEVGRPTVREAIQRLEKDGWLTCRKGHSPIINDYWNKGNLTTLVHLLRHHETITEEFIVYLLELRISLTPTYIRDAVAASQEKVVAELAHLERLKNEAESYATFDWQLQRSLAALSHNPIYLLILNSFHTFYHEMAMNYFAIEEHRNLSFQFYNDLLAMALLGDAAKAEKVARSAMEKSLTLWKTRKKVEE